MFVLKCYLLYCSYYFNLTSLNFQIKLNRETKIYPTIQLIPGPSLYCYLGYVEFE